MNKVWQWRLSYRRKRLAYWRSKGNIPNVNKWIKLVHEAEAHLRPAKPVNQQAVDVSSYQGNIDWHRVKKAGVAVGIVKATEGVGYVDPTFSAARIKSMRAAGVRVGCYAFLRPTAGRSGATEAAWFIKTCHAAGALKPGDLRPVLDFEATSLNPAQTIRYVREAVAEVKRLTGHAPILYVGAYYWPEQGGGRDNFGCALWLPAYQSSPPKLPAAWKSWAMWQYTSTGRVDGISGDCDLSHVKELVLL